MKVVRLLCFVSLLTSLFTFSSLGWAQSATSSLSGTVSDANQAVIPGAELTLTNSQTGFSRTIKSGGRGDYQFLQVPPAPYQLTISAPGFGTVKRDNVVLQVSSPATVNVTLQVATQSVMVEVHDEAPAVNTTDASLGHNFDSKQLIDLPSEGRDPVAILSLQPGVVYIGKKTHDQQNDDSRGGSVNGARSDQTNITLDGLDNNDQLEGYAFEGALRTTLDSLQEFRVTTSSADADSGRSSGAQVNLVTKSGTNSIHGSLYEYHRPTFAAANDWFNKQAELKAGLPNRPGKVLRNTFGASVGGPIKKDRVFFFSAYEGQRTAETLQTTRTVPSDNLRNGIISYLCDPSVDANCAVGNSGGVSIAADSRFPNSLVATLTPTQFASLDTVCSSGPTPTCPLGPGANPLIANVANGNPNAVFNLYPHANTDASSGSDALNFRGLTFAAPNPIKHDTYIAKLDFNLTRDGHHTLFVRGNLQNDHTKTPPQFSGQPANDYVTDNSKGVAAGYTALLSDTLINNFRYAFIRQGTGTSGASPANFINFRGLDDLHAVDGTAVNNVPVHNFVDDVSWTKGNHTLQFGGNLRLIHNNRQSNQQNFTEGSTNLFWLSPSFISGAGVSLDPATASGFPAVEGDFGGSYDFAAIALAGIVSEVTASSNKDKSGNLIASGALVSRHFQSFESELYIQDKWRVKPSLTVTYGVRYSLLQPPYENRGNQVSPTISLHDWFNQRGHDQAQGLVTQPDITFDLSGNANHGKPIWNWDYRNLAPRFAIAYSPDNGKSSIRAGYGLYFDHFGQGVINTFDRQGSYGLTTTQENPAGIQTVDGAPRFTGLNNIPSLLNPPPPGPFPYTPSGDPNTSGLAIAWGLDDKLKTPYSHVFDLAYTREMGKGLVLEATYTGRLGRRLLQEADLAQPLDLVDPKSKTDYFTAATQLAKLAAAGTPINSVAPIPYWEDMFPLAAGGGLLSGTAPNIPCSPGTSPGDQATATQNMYDSYFCNFENETLALENADVFCFPACAGPSGTPFQYYQDQFASLYAWRSQGKSSYNGLQLSLRHPLSSGVQFDINYTFSKSIDVGSNAERVNGFESQGIAFNSQVINAWSPNLWRAVSDFDTKHQFNTNWVWDLPYGKGRHWGAGSHGVMEALLGGWGFNGLARWTSGFPFTVQAGAGWATNFELEGSSVLTGPKPTTGTFRDSDGDPNIFKNPLSLGLGNGVFRATYPGEAGQRNNFRGPGYFGIDTGLGKVWIPKESQEIRFSWEIFNLTNSVRFDAAGSIANESLLGLSTFGKYVQTLTDRRVMQFGLRYSF
jgi:Carboxypeptidase regulatory-like domain